MSIENKIKKLQAICDEKFGKLYDLSKSEIKGERDEFKAICLKHGEFITTPRKITENNQLICPKCAEEKEKEDFFNKMHEFFGDNYDFSKFGFPPYKEKSIVICKKHGEFEASRQTLTQRHGCPKCGREKIGLATLEKNKQNSKTYEEAMQMIKDRIGEEAFNNFIFDESSYQGTTKNMRVFCIKHGQWFERTPNRLSQGRGCDMCSYEHKYGSLNTYQKSFEELAREVHKREDGMPLYDYLGYDEKEDKYIMYCHEKDEEGNEHGEFKQTRGHHLSGQGCPICRYIKSGEAKRNSLERLKEDIQKYKSDKNYVWDFDSYIAYDKPMKIYCKEKYPDGTEHGLFINTPKNLFNKYHPQNCPVCGRLRTAEAKRVTPEEFIERAIKIHHLDNGEQKYLYDSNDYQGYYEDMKMICRVHGEFWQTPANHLQGQGCPYCKESRLEKQIRDLLVRNEINFIPQANSKIFEWVGKLSLDFYLPDYNIAIECQGKQHFNLGGWNEPFEVIQERDGRKRRLCEANGIKLLYFSNLGIEYPYQVFEDENLLMEEIIKR